jgi:hypothetical protein
VGAGMRYQPQGLIRRNPESRIATAAQSLLLANGRVNLATGVALRSSGTIERVPGPSGVALRFSKNGYVQTEVMPAIGTRTFVEFWYGYPSDGPAERYASGSDAQDPGFLTGSSANQLGIFQAAGNRYGSGAQWGCVYNWDAGNASAFTLSGESLPLGGPPVLLVAVRRQTGTELWRDGKMVNFVSQAPRDYPAQSLICGAFVEDINYWSSRSSTLMAGRVIIDPTADEIRQFSRNPWQLFQTPDDEEYLKSSAGGAGATVGPAGVGALAAVGTPQASGGARAAPAGISALAGIGIMQATAAAQAGPAGVSAAVSIGAAAPSGGAIIAVSGVASAASAGTVSASGASVGMANPAGVVAFASVGAVSVRAGAVTTTVGVSAAASVGAVVATGAGAGVAAPAGVMATVAVGAAQAIAGARVAPTGVAAAASVGIAAATGGASVPGTATPAGIGAAATVGTPAVSGGAGAAPVGVSATITLGQVIASGNIIIGATAQPIGVTAYARVGVAMATGGASVNYARAPDGAGFTPKFQEQSRRAAQVGSNRPENRERSTR